MSLPSMRARTGPNKRMQLDLRQRALPAGTVADAPRWADLGGVMARPDLQQLYQERKASRFGFLARGEHDVRAIYRIVKARYPRLCDDRFLCSQNCSRGHE